MSRVGRLTRRIFLHQRCTSYCLAPASGLRAGLDSFLSNVKQTNHPGSRTMRFVTELWQRIGSTRAARHGRPNDRRSPIKPTLRFRPRLETLEDRCVPSTLMVTSPLDDVNVQGTLRYDLAHAANGDKIKITPNALNGASLVLSQGELFVNKNVTIEATPNNPAIISGGGNSRVFEIASGANVTLKNLTITGGTGVANNPSGSSRYDGIGGGVLNFGTLTVSNCTLTSNHSSGGGGGIDNYNGMLTVSNSTLSDNSAAYSGGSIFNYLGTVAVSNSTLANNSASYGGAISGYSATVTVSNSTLSDNTAFGGGGIYIFDGTLTVNNSSLSGNSVLQGVGGGGILDDGGSATISNSTLSNNSAQSGFGGAIWNLDLGTVTVSNSTLSDNSATFGGGIENYYASNVTLSNSTLSGNSASKDGGGIFNLGTLTVNNSTLSGNSAGIYGGGIENYLGTLAVSGSILSDNSAGSEGGGIYNNVYGTLYLSGNSFSGNSPDDIYYA